MKVSHWWLILTGLQLMDLATTYVGLGIGASEQNPVGVYVLQFGFGGLVVMKIIAMIGAFGIAWVNMHLGHKRFAKMGLATGAIMMVAVVASNSYAIFRILATQG